MMTVAVAAACGTSDERRASPAGDTAEDSAFRAMQARGRAAMGVDQYTSAHIFEPLPDGGRIVLQRSVSDSAGAEAIRAHMREIALAFSRGDFSIPGFVHAQAVPGTDVMRARRAVISYEPHALPRGAEVRIRSSDSIAVAAIHDFLAFQRMEHHAPAHETLPHSHP